MQSSHDVNQKLNSLKIRLTKLGNAWSVNEYESFLHFFVSIIPKIMDAERCSIFIVEPGKEEIWLKFGTGLKNREISAPREGTVVGDVVSSGKLFIRNDIKRGSVYHDNLALRTKFVTRNLVCAPIKMLTEEGITGAVEVLNKQSKGQFTSRDGELLQEIAYYLSMAMENIMLNEEILNLSEELKQAVDGILGSDEEFIAKSAAMQNIIDTVRIISSTPVNVLLQGESGTGKELVARMIHRGSNRRDKPFVAINCASIPEKLMESEFFGYEKGAFTGAVTSRGGYFEDTSGGTLFLDEVGELPLVMQPKFLRVIQEGEGKRLGSSKPVRYDMRLIIATNKDLRQEVAMGRFREDLFYRIFSVEICIPPLRERREDIIPLAMLLLDKVNKRFNKYIPGFAPEIIDIFESFPWKGNARQVLREIERMVAITPEGQTITLSQCSPELRNWKGAGSFMNFRQKSDISMSDKVRELEIISIKEALEKTKGNKVKASKELGITRQGLDKKIRRYNIQLADSGKKSSK